MSVGKRVITLLEQTKHFRSTPLYSPLGVANDSVVIVEALKDRTEIIHFYNEQNFYATMYISKYNKRCDSFK